jgi:hypothetical protein
MPHRRANGGAYRTHSLRLALILFAAFSALSVIPLTGCTRDPIAWEEPTVRSALPPADARLTLDGAGRVGFVSLALPPPPAAATGCLASLRFATGGRDAYAAWWAVRADSSAVLLVARSDDGGVHWTTPVPVDTLDRSTLGCRRPAPAIAVDSMSGYVHLAYFLQAVEGPGIFFSHSMERGAIFHAPVAIVYGERISAASIAAQGNAVVVAYEDPNSARPRIAVALSRSDGHLFDARLPVSSANVSAAEPRVALRGHTLAVSWMERTGAPDDGEAASATAVPAVAEAAAAGGGRSGNQVVRIGRF